MKKKKNERSLNPKQNKFKIKKKKNPKPKQNREKKLLASIGKKKESSHWRSTL